MTKYSRFIGISLLLLILSIASADSALPDSLTRFLAKYMHFKRNDMAAVARGETVAKSIDTRLGRELAFFGITHVNAPPPILVKEFRDIENFKKSKEVLKVKKLSNPPVRDDFNLMKLEKEDIKDLKKCRPGKCALKMSEHMILGMQKGMAKGESPDSVYQDLLFEYVQSYLARGSLCEYNDEKKVVRVADEFKGILENSPYLKDDHPDFYAHLAEGKALEGVERFIYWSKETLGFRAVISLTEVSIYQPSNGHGVIISKQIYANHYMNASVAITLVVPDQTNNPQGFYMMYINRSRTDMLSGLLAGLKRSIAKSRSTSAVKENVSLIKKRLEE